MGQYKVHTPDGEFVVTADAPPDNDTALKLVREQHYDEEKPSEPSGEGGSWLPGIGEFGGSIVGGMATGGTPLGVGGGAALGRAAGSAIAGEGVPSLSSLGMTAAVNATGEKAASVAMSGAKRMLSTRPFQTLADDILSKLRGLHSAGPEWAGPALVDDIVMQARPKVRAQSKAYYDTAMSTAKRLGLTIENPNKVADVANEFLTQIGDPSKAADPKTATKIVLALKNIAKWNSQSSVINRLGMRTHGGPSFEDYYYAYQGLKGTFKDFSKLGMPSNVEEAVQGRLLGAMKADIDRAIKGTPVQQQLATAHRYWQTELQPFRKLIFRPAIKVLRDEPERAVDFLLQPGRSSRFTRWWTHAGAEERQMLREAWMQRALEGSENSATGVHSAGAFAKSFYALDHTTRDKLFDGQADTYKALFQYLSSAQLSEELLGQTGGMLRGAGPGGFTAHATYALFRGDITGAMMSLAAAGGLAKAFSSPKIAKLILKGVQPTASQKAKIKLGQQIVTAATVAGLIDPMAQGAFGLNPEDEAPDEPYTTNPHP